MPVIQSNHIKNRSRYYLQRFLFIFAEKDAKHMKIAAPDSELLGFVLKR